MTLALSRQMKQPHMILNFPPPANWQDFQVLTGRLVEQHCVEGTVREHGRQGQRQQGVDVYGEMPGELHMGVQCKEMQSGKKLTKEVIEAEANEALKFRPKLNTFVVATTLAEDVNIHRAVTELNQSGVYPFKVTYWSWKHFNDRLNRSNRLVQDSYKSYAEGFGHDQELEDLEALRKGFDRPAFIDDFRHELNCDDFVQALDDTALFLQTGLLRDRYTQSLVSATYALSMLPTGKSKKLRSQLKKEVDELRTRAIKDHADGRLSANLASEYNARRYGLLATVNAGLELRGVAAIFPNYS